MKSKTKVARARRVRAREIPGAGLLLIAAGASSLLALQGLSSIPLPGCGLESGCERAVHSAWGRLPGLDWPLSYVGVAFFLGLLGAWLTGAGSLSAALRWLVRLGALSSVVLLAVMLRAGYLCPYCVATHVANLAFAALLELRARARHDAGSPAPARSPSALVGAFAGIFTLVSAALAIAHVRHQATIRQHDQAELARSTQEIVEGTGSHAPEPTRAAPFTGRYRRGPEQAAIRIVIISDYQCQDCRQIEAQVRTVLEQRDDVSFSAKHFPFCSQCNPAARNRNLHPNACWAARAAETAGLVGGDAAFWKMHHWLFERGGSFTDAEIQRGLVELGFDPGPFLARMQSAESLQPVLADIEEAAELGLRQTPMIFINGVQLLGWRAPNALLRAVDELAASHPPARTAAADRPPRALEKYLREWREAPVVALPSARPGQPSWSLGDPSAPAQVVIWGDYQEPFSAALDRRVRAFVEQEPGVHYTFRHYPVDQTCNPSASQTMHPKACRAAKAAEAAGRLGGPQAFWRMHAWLFDNIPNFDDSTLSAAASAMGLDAQALLREMESPELAAAIRADADAAQRLGLSELPFFWINGKRVPFWNLEDQPLVESLLQSRTILRR